MEQFNTYMSPPTNYPTSHQIEMVPPGSSLFESSYHGDHQSPTSFHNGAIPFDRSCYFYHWQIPNVECITDIQPNDGTYA